MEPRSFKFTPDCLLLCVCLSLLRGVTTSSISPTPTPTSTVPTTSSTSPTPTPTSTVPTTSSTSPTPTPTSTVPTTSSTSPTPTPSPPEDVKKVTVVTQNESSITLKWEKVNNITTYILGYDGNNEKINAPQQWTSVQYVVSPLVAGTKYNFTLITVFEGRNSSGYRLDAVTAPRNAEELRTAGQNETSITLQWKRVDNIRDYIVKFNEEERNISATEGNELVKYTISGLTNTIEYNFTLLTVFGNVRSSGVNLTAVTAPRNAEEFGTAGQNETSITLQWKRVDNIRDYIVKFNEEERNISATEGNELVKYTISGLTNTIEYNFTLLTVFGKVRSSGVNVIAVTAPRNAEEFGTDGQTETSITLQWKRVDNIRDYIVKFNKEERNIRATEGNEPVKYTILGLADMTKYKFTLFTVFESVRSSGVHLTAVTAPKRVNKVTVVEQNESSITLKWEKVNNITTYILGYDGNNEKVEYKINATQQGTSVQHVVSPLVAGTKYNFTLITVFEGRNSSGYRLDTVTAPRNAEEFRTDGQTETSISLQWKRVDNIWDYIVKFNEEERNISATEEKVTLTITGLTNTTKYKFTLFTVFGKVRSSGVNVIAVTAPRNAEEFGTAGQTETSITLQWKRVNDIRDYIVEFNEKERNISATEGNELVKYTIPGLTNTTEYNFTLFTVFGTVRSSGVNLTAVTAPANVQNVMVLSQNESTITLKWDKINHFSTYILRYDDNNVTIAGNSTSREFLVHVVSLLSAGRKYHFSLITVFDRVSSSGHTFDAATVPPAVSMVNVTERSARSINLKWDSVNKDWSYLLHINGSKVNITPDVSTSFVSHPVTSLEPGTEYHFSVTTLFSELNSTAYEDFTVTAIDCASVSWHVTNSSIRGVVEGLFSNATASNNGTHHSPGGSNVSFTDLSPGATYEVTLVYETRTRYFEQCRHNLTILPPQLSAYCKYSDAGYSIFIVWNKPVGVWTDVEVNVTGRSRRVPANGEQHLKIPGFLPAKTYKVSLTSLSGNMRSHEASVFLCSTDPRGVIAGSVLAVLLFGFLVCLVAIIKLKRPDLLRKNSFVGGSKLSTKHNKAISVENFPDHFSELCMDENRGFSEEYENFELVGTEQTRKTAVLPENKAKNRFNNVLPYDWCRVKLTTSSPSGASDYINASYMPGYQNNREYIATQGPLPSTVSDFWWMIWEQRVKGIVMVTNCTEGGRVKCEQYWPAENKPQDYGELLITMMSEEKEPDWTLREFSVRNRNEIRTVKHFHFTAWPDHGVPQGTEVLIHFRELVRRHIDQEGAGAPTVVHCSAGVGRTGTFIALDVLLQQLDKKRSVGINAFVHKMRLSRPHMVQTESQYIFLHRCIMDCLQSEERMEEAIYENTDMIYENATALRQFR